MTVRPVSSLLLLLIFSFSAGMADEKKPKKDADDTPEKVAKRKANEVAQATIKSDFAKIADLTYPKVVESMGGRENMIGAMKTGLRDLNARGIKYLSAKVEDATPLVAGDAEDYTIVPYAMEIKVPGGRVTTKTFFLGISSDKGKTWTFVDGSGILNDPLKAKRLLPNLPAKLKLPKKEKPVLRKDE